MSRPIHICVLTTAHPVDDVRVNHKFVRSIVGDGMRVSWVGPGHAFFDSKQPQQAGVEFELVAPNRGRMSRLLSYGRIRRAAARVTGVDVYYAPEPDSAQLALRLSRRNGAKVVFDIHEVYHGPMLDRWLMGRRLNFIRDYVRRSVFRICGECDLVVGVSDAVLASYVPPGSRWMVIRSCTPAWFADGPAAEVCGPGRHVFRLMHGKGALERGTMKVLEALKIAAERSSGLSVVMFEQGNSNAGAQTDGLRVRASELGVEGLLDLRRGVPMQEMPAILRTCDIGLIAYGRSLGADSLPNRLFEYMAVGIPIIAPVYSTEIAKIVDAEKCGMLVNFEDPTSIAAAIVKMRQDPIMCQQMGARARDGFLKRHNFEAEVRPFLEAIHGWFPNGGK